MYVVSDLSESLDVSSKLPSACLGADGKRQARTLIYRLLLIKLIHFENEASLCLAVNKRVLGDKSDSWKNGSFNTQGEINADKAQNEISL